MIKMCRAELIKDQTLTALQLYEEVKCKVVVYYEDLKKEDQSDGEAAKSQEVPEQLASNQGVGLSVKYKVKKEAVGTCGSPAARSHVHACCGGQAHSMAQAHQQNSSCNGLAGDCT